MRYVVNNVMDGEDVAKIIGLFVNSFKYPSEEFYELMQYESEGIRHNFTALCIEWFEKLSTTSRYDGRNEDSVSMARDIKSEFDGEKLFKHKIVTEGIWSHCEGECLDDAAAVNILSSYLSLSQDNSRFIDTMLYYVHLTNQQSFSNMCGKWLCIIAKEYSKKKYVLWAKKAAKHCRRLPMV